MGHSIQHYVFDVNEDKGRIFAIANDDALEYGDYNSGLNSNIRFIENKIYSDREEAEKAIERLDRGWYDQLAVKFYNYEPVKDTKQIENLESRVEKERQSLADYKEKNAIKNRKTNFVGCSGCGSRINKKYIPDAYHLWNRCPLCRHDLSSETMKKTIENKVNKIKSLDNELKQKRRENNKKGKKSVSWLVKTEFHV